MLTLSTAQIDAWIAFYAFPMARILAMIATAPLWSTAGIPRRTRLILGLAITIGIAPPCRPCPMYRRHLLPACGYSPNRS